FRTMVQCEDIRNRYSLSRRDECRFSGWINVDASRDFRAYDVLLAQILNLLTGRRVGVVTSKLIDAMKGDPRLFGKQATWLWGIERHD
ncbi:MAG: hypothetical protein ABJC87_08825, partial [Roseobacter sp.]